MEIIVLLAKEMSANVLLILQLYNYKSAARNGEKCSQGRRQKRSCDCNENELA